MEIKDIYKKMMSHKIYLVVSTLVGVLIGVAVYFLPSKYVANGSFFINRAAGTSNSFYTYDGYYAQQTALTYTNSVVVLMQGTDIKKMVLESNKVATNQGTLRWLSRIVNIRKTGPQVISLSVKGKTYGEALDLWNSFANVTLAATYQINKTGDPNLSITQVSPQPLVSLPYKSMLVFGLAGALIAFTLTSFCICLKEYFRD